MNVLGKAKTKAKSVRSYYAVKHSEYFSPEWYCQNYGAEIKNPAKHYCNTGWLLGYDPSAAFSTSEYLENNPDVRENGINPLAHFELFGRGEGRKPIYSVSYTYEAKGTDYISSEAPPAGMKRCAVFASYSADGTIPDYVVYYLKELSKVTDGIVFVADNKLIDEKEFDKIKDYVFRADFCRHGTYDFGSWKRGLTYLAREGILSSLDELVLANDSCYGPVNGFEGVFDKMRARGCDFWGLVDTKEPQYHLLSFFYALERRVLEDTDYLLAFFNRINGSHMSFWQTVNFCEREFTLYLKEKYSCGCLVEDSVTEKMALCSGNFNPTVWPETMLEAGLPLAKVKLFDGRFGIECHENPDRVLESIKKANPELYHIILKDLERRLKTKPESCRGLMDDYCLAIENKELVSFDVFDTLLTRPFCEPTDLFKYMECRYNAQGFAKERQLAEKRARMDTEEPEVTLDKIYEHILPRFRAMKELELQTELDCARPNPNVKKLYEQAVALGKRIIAVSDMYLPADFIQKLLLKAGYHKIEKLFVSCEYNKTKGTGLLYLEALKHCGVEPGNAIHFGDNMNSDVACARKANLKAQNTSKIHEYFMDVPANFKYKSFYEQHEDTAASVYTALIAHRFARMDEESCFHTALGYTLGGPLALGYVDFICRQAKANGIDHLMFAARDGYVLKQIYEKYFMAEYGIPCSYVYLNRAVVLGATEGEPEKPNYLKTLLELAKDNGVPVQVFGEDNDSKNRSEFRAHADEIRRWQEKNAALLKKHLEQACGNAKSIAVVDMASGKFTSLKGARAALGNRVAMGLFTGVFPVGSTVIPYASFCNRYLDSNDDIKIQFSEFLITSPEDSVLGLDEDGKPVYEKAVDTGRRERNKPILEGIGQYCEDFLQCVQPCRETLLSFEQWLELTDSYVKLCNDADLHYLAGVTDTPNPVESQKSSKLVDLINSYKKQV